MRGLQRAPRRFLPDEGAAGTIHSRENQRRPRGTALAVPVHQRRPVMQHLPRKFFLSLHVFYGIWVSEKFAKKTEKYIYIFLRQAEIYVFKRRVLSSKVLETVIIFLGRCVHVKVELSRVVLETIRNCDYIPRFEREKFGELLTGEYFSPSGHFSVECSRIIFNVQILILLSR